MRALALVLGLAACSPLPDTVGEAAPSQTLFTLVEVNGAPAPYRASLRLLQKGGVRGSAPCGPLTAEQTAPLPWVEFSDIRTFETCEDGGAQAAYVALLSRMEFAEVAGDALLLTNIDGETLFYRAGAPGV